MLVSSRSVVSCSGPEWNHSVGYGFDVSEKLPKERSEGYKFVAVRVTVFCSSPASFFARARAFFFAVCLTLHSATNSSYFFFSVAAISSYGARISLSSSFHLVAIVLARFENPTPDLLLPFLPALFTSPGTVAPPVSSVCFPSEPAPRIRSLSSLKNRLYAESGRFGMSGGFFQGLSGDLRFRFTTTN